MKESGRRPRPLTDGYIRQTLLKRLQKTGVEKADITPEMIELEREKLEMVRNLREIKKIRQKGGRHEPRGEDQGA